MCHTVVAHSHNCTNIYNVNLWEVVLDFSLNITTFALKSSFNFISHFIIVVREKKSAAGYLGGLCENNSEI